MKIRAALITTAMLLIACTTACGNSTTSTTANPGVAELSALAAQDARTAGEETTGPAAPLIDPCTALTKADVQPFLTAQIVTALPTILSSDQEKSCEWAPTNKTSSLIVDYLVGDSAQTKLMLNQQQPDTEAVAVPDVGEGASHPSGDPSLLFSWEGSGSTAVVCTVTTTGNQFSLVADPAATLTADQATQIDEQYGTLCNKLYGSGNTTPSVPQVSISSASPLPSLTVPVPADSGTTMPGTGIPLPSGVDCSGTNTAKDTMFGLSCEQPITDALAVYTFFLTALPAHGYTINSQQYYPAADGGAANATLMFTDDADGLCFITIGRGQLTVSKQEN